MHQIYFLSLKRHRFYSFYLKNYPAKKLQLDLEFGTAELKMLFYAKGSNTPSRSQIVGAPTYSMLALLLFNDHAEMTFEVIFLSFKVENHRLNVLKFIFRLSKQLQISLKGHLKDTWRCWFGEKPKSWSRNQQPTTRKKFSSQILLRSMRISNRTCTSEFMII